MNMGLIHISSAQQTRLTADKRALQTIGLLFAFVTLLVIGAAGLAVRHELGTPADLTQRAGLPHTTATGT